MVTHNLGDGESFRIEEGRVQAAQAAAEGRAQARRDRPGLWKRLMARLRSH